MSGEISPQAQIDSYAAALGNSSVRLAMGEGTGASAEKTAEQYANYLETYGLGPQDVNQQVEWGTYKGTVRSMLDDEKCPVGGMVAKAYEEDGIAGVQAKLTGLGELDPKFVPKISEDTHKYHADGKVKQNDFIKAQLEKRQAEPPREKPDFLAL
jgi:hypothetical protein